ncbi:RagB/SusD family nutrient uptake outer membrane protein [Myroides sp. N17-2]|uniref:RagB/SusD family nutrient uptake outer membrane protein n=1 Tax=Myroides sp. N17-2 TaxID=2030799 RepID=UPI000EFA322E|nr:RagB/SusD family nutrient uptake outer membrane protein [Myroides sp. N17-2]
MKRYIRIVMLSGLLSGGMLSVSSCSLDPEQSSKVDNEKSPIRTVEELEAGIIGSYARMTSSMYYGRDMIIFSESRAPYAYSTGVSGRFDNISGFTLQTTHAYPRDTWNQIYRVIANTNRVLEAELGSDKGLVDYFKGQGYIIRALAHYDLMRLYGEQYVNNTGLTALGIPYITKFGQTKAEVQRQTVASNKQAIFQDLDLGIELMKNSLDNAKSKESRVKINLSAAYALKSRIALFFAHYDSTLYNVVAESASLSIKEANRMNVSVAPRAGFLDGYKSEAVAQNSIFEFAQSGTDHSGVNSLFYIYNVFANGGGYGDVIWNGDVTSVFPEVMDGLNSLDIRQDVVTKDYQGVLRNTGKFTAMSSNIKMLRIEEVMFNYMEAAVKGASNADKGVALNYLNTIVSNRVLLVDPKIANDAGKPKTYIALDFETVKKERTKELMFEGLGYEDVMRWEGVIKNPKTDVNTNLSTKGEVRYGDVLTAFPIPISEINVSKIDQNQGYK